MEKKIRRKKFPKILLYRLARLISFFSENSGKCCSSRTAGNFQTLNQMFSSNRKCPGLCRTERRETNSHVDSVTPFCSLILLRQRSPNIDT